MTMILSGNGSIAGLVAGGLPDATVTAPDLASGAARTNFGAGTVLQVVNVVYSTSTSSSSSTLSDTGLTATITPTSATSKILVLVNHSGCGKGTNSTYLQIVFARNSTYIYTIEGEAAYNNALTSNSVGSVSSAYLDSPSTTSPVTYKTRFASVNNNAVVYLNGSGATSTMTLMEIAA